MDGVVTHYYLPDRRPFRNLSDLDDAAVAPVLAGLNGSRKDGLQFRPFGPQYMGIRRRTEQRLRQLFIARGGTPERMSPHYFVYGASEWFERLAVGMQQVQLPLSALPPEQTSVTYPDSFAAIGHGPELGQREPRPYHDRVFLLDELEDLVARFGVPDPEWEPEHLDWRAWPAEAYIEVQLWCDAPVRRYLS